MEYSRICKKHMDATMRSFITKMIIMVLSYSAALTGPAYVYYTTGIKSTTIELRIPFTQGKSNAEFWVNILYMFAYATYGALLYIGLEVAMAIFENTVTVTPDLIRMEINHLAVDYQNKKKSISKLELLLRIRNIVKQCLDLDE